jgi:hypothetical protein
MCAQVGNQRSRGVVIAQVQTDAVQSLRHQRRDLYQSTYLIPLRRSGLILLLDTITPQEINQGNRSPRTPHQSTPTLL